MKPAGLSEDEIWLAHLKRERMHLSMRRFIQSLRVARTTRLLQLQKNDANGARLNRNEKGNRMKLNQVMPKKYFSGADMDAELGGGDMTLKINRVSLERMKDEQGNLTDEEKPVLYFEERKEGLILNPTRKAALLALFGTDDTDEYLGKSITVYTVDTPKGASITIKKRVAPAARLAKASEAGGFA